MDKVYVVTAGTYSVYRILEIFTNLEDAEKYCAWKNEIVAEIFGVSPVECAKHCWEVDCRIEEYPIDNVQFASSEKPMKKRFLYTRDHDDKGDKEYLRDCDVVYAKESAVKVTEYTKEHITVAALVDYGTSDEKVQKIIYDEIARYEATVNHLI